MIEYLGVLISILFSLNLVAQEERRATLVTKGFMPYAQTKDYMLGNNEYGFFIQNLDDSKAICRIRIKIECDYGLGVVKPAKNTNLNIVIAKNEMGIKTDDTGLADGWFRCEPSIAEKNIEVSIKNFEGSYKVKKFPKSISMSEKQCW